MGPYGYEGGQPQQQYNPYSDIAGQGYGAKGIPGGFGGQQQNFQKGYNNQPQPPTPRHLNAKKDRELVQSVTWRLET